MQIAILLFERVTALDAIGPYQVFSNPPGNEVVFVGERVGPVRTTPAASDCWSTRHSMR